MPDQLVDRTHGRQQTFHDRSGGPPSQRRSPIRTARGRHDQLVFNRWIARQAHARGLSIGLKNDGRQARRLVRHFDFAVVEQCIQYRECGLYQTFVAAGKAVFAVEYDTAPSGFCPVAARLGFAATGKSPALRARPWQRCPA